MALSNSSTRSPRKPVRFWIQDYVFLTELRLIVIFGLSVVFFGIYGFMHEGNSLTLGSAILNACALFFMVMPAGANANAAINIARALVVITFVLSAWKIIASLVANEWEQVQLRRIRHHVIICGLSQIALSTARTLASSCRVLIIDKAPSLDLIAACRPLGVIVLTGDATNADTLKTARIHRAKQLIALCPDDSTNCEIAEAASRQLAHGYEGSEPLSCRIQVGDIETRTSFQNLLTAHRSSGVISSEFFDAFDLEARRLLVQGLPIDHGGITFADKQGAHLILVGCNRMGRAIITRAAQLGIFATPQKLKITVIDPQVEQCTRQLLFHHPQLTDICDCTFHQVEPISPQARDILNRNLDVRDMKTSIVVCVDSEQSALELGMQIRQMTEGKKIPCAIYMMQSRGILRLLEQGGSALPGSSGFHVFGFQGDAVANDSADRFARNFHKGYLQLNARNGKPVLPGGEEPTGQKWENLSEDLRDSNRQASEHMYIKLRSIGLEAAEESDTRPAIAELTPEQIEILADVEHRRWMAERRMANWTYAAHKDVQRRESPYLVPWNDLSEEIREYDRASVRDIPQRLREIKKKICCKK
jgi:voltage-gated potassium channel Kch